MKIHKNKVLFYSSYGGAEICIRGRREWMIIGKQKVELKEHNGIHTESELRVLTVSCYNFFA